MPDEVPMVTSCPLCLAPDEVESMVPVQIERAIPKGRAAIMICRNCTVAVMEAAAQAEPPLLSTLLADVTHRAEVAATTEATRNAALDYLEAVGEETQAESAKLHAGEAYPCPPGCELHQWGVEHTHTREEDLATHLGSTKELGIRTQIPRKEKERG